MSIKDTDNLEFEYRYVQYNPIKSNFNIYHIETAIWEREPNRRMEITTDLTKLENNDLLDRCEELLANSTINRLDINFVADFRFNKMGSFPIYIGPYPQNEDEIETMANSGVTAVLNVQTDRDLKHRQVNWEAHLRAYLEHDIKVIRYPIEDFNQEDLIKKLKGAGDALSDLVSDEKTVYVHCTAGMSRAAATVIIYLVFYQNYTLEDAFDFVKSHREIICPNMKAIEKVINDNQ
jgi:protein-tyrosine phosphatase